MIQMELHWSRNRKQPSGSEKRNSSFQRQGRSYQELIGEISAPYQGYPVWKKGAGGEEVCGFLLQYEETD